ncbi:hypothetical protein SAMN05216389_107125 [Oceanobacillus limi]|uniref:Uncharacterized protein n=1 Tax=Oceanobacillus limi TaxID=930131 RepID=A0A1I0CYZ9_9BACI|nr:hypothetical protein SAMN05216389_107125 [Oceanobacillus limi]
MLTITFTLVTLFLFTGFLKWNNVPRTIIIPLWLFIVFFSGLIINSIFTNLKYIAKPKHADPYISLIILQYFILPISILLLLNVYNTRTFPLKASSILIAITFSIIFERFLERIKIIEYINWNIGFSLLLWLSIIFSSILFYRFINNFFVQKEGSDV